MDPTRPPPSADQERLLLFLRRVMALATFFAALEFGVAVWFRHWGLAASAGLLLLIGLAGATARALAGHGAVRPAAEIIGYALLGYAVFNGFFIPFANPVSLIVPVLAVTASLPYLTGRRLQIFLGVSLGAELMVAAYQVRLQPPVALPSVPSALLVILGVSASSYLSFILLTRFTRRLQDLAQRANESEIRAHLLKTVAAGLSQAPSVRDVASASLVFACQILDSPSGCVLVRGEGEALRTIAARGPALEVDPAPVLSGERELWRCDARSGQETVSAMCAALSVAQRSIGAVAVAINPDHPPTQDQQELLIATARLCAQALERATLYDEVNQAVRLRDDFLSIAGHELRTPLTALQLYVQSLARKPALDEARWPEASQKLTRHVARLRQLIERLLDVSRITAGRLVLNPEAVELRSLLAEVIDRHADELRLSGSSCSLKAEGEIVGLWDRMRLEQIATNLLSNAIKYGEGKPIEVTVARAPQWATLTVRDHGMGIPAEDQKRIFQRFERAVSGRHYGGLGLGLWIVGQLVEAMGGSIEVSSRPGEGATFTVRLPAGAD